MSLLADKGMLLTDKGMLLTDKGMLSGKKLDAEAGIYFQ